MNNGKDLEQRLQSALFAYQETHNSHYFRLYDATSSGGKGHRNPGDFVWLVTKAVLIECKSTENGTCLLESIRRSKNSRQQTARHELWHRSGHPSIYVFADILARIVTVYDGKSVLTALNKKTETPKLLATSGLYTIDTILPAIAREYL